MDPFSYKIIKVMIAHLISILMDVLIYININGIRQISIIGLILKRRRLNHHQLPQLLPA